jgi:hypothetical protein
MSFHVTALPPYGGIVLLIAIGAVVEGMPTTLQMPLSGHFCPVLANVPNGFFIILQQILWLLTPGF